MILKHRRILLTGATGGIGEEIAAQLLQSGASVLLHGRSSEKLNQLLEKFKYYEGKVEVLSGDLCSAEDRLSLVQTASEIEIDSLINSAGINEFSLFEQVNIDKIIQTNVIATMLLTQALIPQLMGNAKTSLIVNVGSTFGTIGFPGYVAYCASKHAIKGFTEALSREYSDGDIRILYVSPRATLTEMNDSNATKANEDMGVKMDAPRLVARAVVSAILKDQSRSQLGWPEKFQVKVNSLLPFIVDGAIAKQLPTIKYYLSKKQGNSHV